MTNLKLIVLTNKQILLSQIDEVGSELGEPDCRLNKPLLIEDGNLVSWFGEYTDQEEFMIHSDKILTIAEPKKNLIDKYEVLSIDLDYIMEPSIEIYNGIHFDDNPSLRWEQLFDNVPFKESHFEINQANLLYCYKTFLKALKNCDSVSFGYEHDSILFSIDDFTNIDLINIDHHDDVFGGDYSLDMSYDEALKKEYYEIVRHDRVHEGNWGAWLMSKDKLNSFTWIGNKNSGNKLRNQYNQELIGNYQNLEREDYVFEDYNFDHIFVCLSPQYTPKNHWHYFSMFISAYEQFWGKNAIIHTEKYETHIRHQRLHNEILHQCSDGRGSLSGEGL